MAKSRELYFFKNYFEEFYDRQPQKVQRKILWTFKIIEEVERIPKLYLKKITNSAGIYEIRIQVGSNIFRIFCFFDLENIVVVGNAFQKKSQKTPKEQIRKAEQIKNEYYASKDQSS